MLVFLVVIGVAAVAVQITVRNVWERTLREQIERNLQQKTLMFGQRVENDRVHPLGDVTSQAGQAAGARATVIDPTGKVLADSENDPRSLAYEAQSPEFAAALSGHLGMEQRPGRPLGIPILYVAVPVSGGAVR